MLEFGKEVLDQVTVSVEVAIVAASNPAIGFGGDHGPLSSRRQRLDNPSVGIECLVGDQRVGLHDGEQVVGSDQIMHLPARQEEAHGIAQRVDHRVDLGAQSAARAADRLVCAGFFWAPALC